MLIQSVEDGCKAETVRFVRESGKSIRVAAGELDLVFVRTFSKIYGMAGLRLGYAVASEPVIAALQRHAETSNANGAVLEAARTSLDEPGLVAARRAAVVDARRRLYGELDRDRRPYICSETNFVMIRIGADVGPLVQRFKKRGI